MTTATTASNEILRVEDEVRQIALPPGVSFTRIEMSRESTGEPAWRIYFTVARKLKLKPGLLDSLSKVDSEVFRRIQALDFGKWPFTIWLEGK